MRVRDGLKAVGMAILAVMAFSLAANLSYGAEVTVSVPVGPPTYDFSRSSAEISTIGGDKLARGLEAHGLTSWGFTLGIRKMDVSYKTGDNGQVTLTIKYVDLDGEISPWAVYVDRNYPEGSCERREVLAHENKHVAHSYAASQSSIPAIKAAVERVAEEPVIAPTLNEAKSLVVQRVRAAVKQAMKPFAAIASKQDEELDSPKSYAWTAARCHNW